MNYLRCLIEEYSNNPDNDTAYLFEEVLDEGFSMFYDVETRRIGGAGHTDIECLYLTKKKKFAVESKVLSSIMRKFVHRQDRNSAVRQ